MIVLVYSEKQSLRAVFPEQCLKATPDLELICNLYGFDMSLCPHLMWLAGTSHIAHIVKETFDAINSTSRVPELIVWMQSQVCLSIIVLFILNDFHWHHCTFIETETP